MKNNIRLKIMLNVIILCSVLLVLVNFNCIHAKATEVSTPVNQWTSLATANESFNAANSITLNNKIYVLGNLDSNNNTINNFTGVYDPVTNTWTTLPNMTQARSQYSSIALGGKIYVTGGFNTTDRYLGSTEVYDPNTNSWTTLANMNIPRQNHNLVVLNGKIYAIGGMNGTGDLSSTEVYNPSNNTWTLLSNMDYNRSTFSTIVLNDKIYAIGGYGTNSDIAKSGIRSSIEVYDPLTNTWTKVSNLNLPRYDHSTAVLNNKIYIIGGSTKNGSTSSMEVYDPSTNICTNLPSMRNSRTHQATIAKDGKIYVTGGIYTYMIITSSGTSTTVSSHSDILKSAEAYNPLTNTWNSLADMNNAQCIPNLNAIDGKIYSLNKDEKSGKILTSVYNMAKMQLNKTSGSINVGDTDTLTATTTPEGIGVNWTSSDTSIATVDNTGKVTAIKSGTVTIVATTTDSSKTSATCTFTVQPEKIELNKTSTSILVGATENLVATVKPSNLSVKWSSSDTHIATVDSNGKITGFAVGTTTITATTTNGIIATCQVTVSEKPETTITLNKTTDSIKVGQTDTLIASTTPSNVSVSWASKDTTIATVDSNGKITGISAGTTTITATTSDGKTATCQVTVQAQDSNNILFTITFSNNTTKQFSASQDEFNSFLNWYDLKSKGTGASYYKLNNYYLLYAQILYFNID